MESQDLQPLQKMANATDETQSCFQNYSTLAETPEAAQEYEETFL